MRGGVDRPPLIFTKINFKKIKRDITLLDLNNVLDEKEIDMLIDKTKNLTVLGRGDV